MSFVAGECIRHSRETKLGTESTLICLGNRQMELPAARHEIATRAASILHGSKMNCRQPDASGRVGSVSGNYRLPNVGMAGRANQRRRAMNNSKIVSRTIALAWIGVMTLGLAFVAVADSGSLFGG